MAHPTEFSRTEVSRTGLSRIGLSSPGSWPQQLGGLARNLLGLLLIIMVLLNVANALGRYLFGQAIEGSDELMVFGMAWLVFLGMPLVALEGRHLRFSFLEQHLPTNRSRLLQAGLDLYVAVLCTWAAFQSAAFVERVAMIGQKSMAAGIPMVIPHSALLFGLSATALVCAGRGCWLLFTAFSAQGGKAND